MSSQTDIAIIGAGIFGLSAAWAALNRGLSVTVHEAAHPGAGASGGLIGALAPHMPEKWNAKKAFQFDALLAAEAFWSEIEAVSGQSTGYARIGRVLPLHDAKSRNLAEMRADEAKTLWQGKAQWNIADLVEELAPAPFGFVQETLTAKLDPARAITALAHAVEAKGAVFAGRATPQSAKGREVIVAAGHQAAALCNMPAGFARGVKGQSALLGATLPDEFPVIYDGGIYVVPQPDGIAVGSTSENEWADPAPDALLDPVIAAARVLVPALRDAPVLTRWAGIRPRARLPDPALGQIEAGVWLMTGGFKVGLGFGPKLGAAMINMVLGQASDLPESFHLAAHMARMPYAAPQTAK